MTTAEPVRRVLIVGVGSIGQRHLRCFAETGRARLAICEPNADLRSQVAAAHPVEAAFEGLEPALAGWPCDAVLIATPAPLHVPLARQAIAAGRSVLIEKPLSTTTESVAQLEAEAKAAGLVVGVAYNHRAFPVSAVVREHLVSGRFGRPLQFIVQAGQHFPTYRPAYREIYYNSHRTGGGAVQDTLTHLFNVGEWLLGPVTTVVADAAHLALPGVEVEDTVNVVARHAEVLASYSLNQHQAPNEINFIIVCERGTLRVEPLQGRWRWQSEPEGNWHEENLGPPGRDSLYQRQASVFLDALAGRGTPLCSLAEGWQTLKVNLATLKSIRERRWVDISEVT